MHEPIIDALRRGANDEALEAASKAVEATPEDAQAHRWLAASLAANGRREEASQSLARALSLAPDEADLHMQHAGLLLGGGALDAAGESLARATTLDPNRLEAYILQAQIALGRNDLEEAERLKKLVSRIEPGHPWVQMVEGMLALRHGDVETAQSLLSEAAERVPDDPQLRYALGFAYMAGGHDAFAEQAFRGVVDKLPNAAGVRVMIAELLRRQGRVDEALDELAPLVSDQDRAPAGLQRFVGELLLAAGRFDQARTPLLAALDAAPDDPRIINALVAVWRRSADVARARAALDAALRRQPVNPVGWRARVAFEAAATPDALSIAERWLEAMPEHVPAMEVRMAVLGAQGRDEEANAMAGRIIDLQPGHGQAEMRRIDALMGEDPDAALARIDALLSGAKDAQARQILEGWRGIALDRAGRHDEAAAAWTALHAASAQRRLPLPELSSGEGPWPERMETQQASPAVAFLVGLPGSRVEQLAIVLGGSTTTFRTDRFGPNPPKDGMQSFDTPRRLLQGEVEPEVVAAAWQAALPARGIDDGQVIDWLPWWDNALLRVLRRGLPQATLLVAVRDPRDMLLDWLAFGSPAQWSIEDVPGAAKWLASALGHLQRMQERDLQPHAVIRLDQDETDPTALAKVLGAALQAPMPVPPPHVLGRGHFGSGHWRNYAQALAEPFAVLTPVAVRLGYPED